MYYLETVIEYSVSIKCSRAVITLFAALYAIVYKSIRHLVNSIRKKNI